MKHSKNHDTYGDAKGKGSKKQGNFCNSKGLADGANEAHNYVMMKWKAIMVCFCTTLTFNGLGIVLMVPANGF